MSTLVRNIGISQPITLTLTFSLADVSKNSTPSWSASCLPRSNEMTRSSSMSHLLPTRITWALSHEYVLICVTLQKPWSVSSRDAGDSKRLHIPVLHRVEALLVGDVVHQDEAHGSTIVGGGDGAIAFLAGSVLHSKSTQISSTSRHPRQPNVPKSAA